MLHYAFLFAMLATIAFIFGLGGLASTTAGIAEMCLFVGLLLFVATRSGDPDRSF